MSVLKSDNCLFIQYFIYYKDIKSFLTVYFVFNIQQYEAEIDIFVLVAHVWLWHTKFEKQDNISEIEKSLAFFSRK